MANAAVESARAPKSPSKRTQSGPVSAAHATAEGVPCRRAGVCRSTPQLCTAEKDPASLNTLRLAVWPYGPSEPFRLIR